MKQDTVRLITLKNDIVSRTGTPLNSVITA